MGLSWRQGPLGRDPNGTFLSATPMPERVLYLEPLRRRMSVELGGSIVARSDGAVILFEPARYPVAYFPIGDIDQTGCCSRLNTRVRIQTSAKRNGSDVVGGDGEITRRGAWEHVDPPAQAVALRDTVAFAWRAMDAFYEEDERILGHAADPYHRIDIRRTSRHLVVRQDDRSSQTPTRRWCSTSLVSRRAGTSPAPTSPLRPSMRSRARRSAHTKVLRPTTNRYGHSSLSADERRRWEKTFEGGEEDAFCRLFGPEKIPAHIDEFLDWFMVRKVMAGQDLLKASGTVTGKLVRWLAGHGYIDEDVAEDAAERAREASRDLPMADRLATLLHEVADSAPEVDVDALAEEDWVEDQLAISDVEPGRIWFEGGVGPIAVSRKASDLAPPGWSAFVTAARTDGAWRLLEVGFVYP